MPEHNVADQDKLLERLLTWYQSKYAAQLTSRLRDRCPVCGATYLADTGLAVHTITVHGLDDTENFRVDQKRLAYHSRVNQDKNYILAIDPGKKSGIALVLKSDPDRDGHPSLMWSDELEWPQIMVRIQATLDSLYGEVDVVIERFTITGGTALKTQSPWSLEIIGATRWVAYKTNAGEITLQDPSSAMRFATNNRLDDLGMWHVGGDGHALDAIRHAVLYMVTKEKWIPPAAPLQSGTKKRGSR